MVYTLQSNFNYNSAIEWCYTSHSEPVTRAKVLSSLIVPIVSEDNGDKFNITLYKIQLVPSEIDSHNYEHSKYFFTHSYITIRDMIMIYYKTSYDRIKRLSEKSNHHTSTKYKHLLSFINRLRKSITGDTIDMNNPKIFSSTGIRYKSFIDPRDEIIYKNDRHFLGLMVNIIAIDTLFKLPCGICEQFDWYHVQKPGPVTSVIRSMSDVKSCEIELIPFSDNIIISLYLFVMGNMDGLGFEKKILTFETPIDTIELLKLIKNLEIRTTKRNMFGASYVHVYNPDTYLMNFVIVSPTKIQQKDIDDNYPEIIIGGAKDIPVTYPRYAMNRIFWSDFDYDRDFEILHDKLTSIKNMCFVPKSWKNNKKSFNKKWNMRDDKYKNGLIGNINNKEKKWMRHGQKKKEKEKNKRYIKKQIRSGNRDFI